MILNRPISYYLKYPDCTVKLGIKFFYDHLTQAQVPETKKQDLIEIQEIIARYDQGEFYDFEGILLSQKGFNLDLFFNVVYPHLSRLNYQLPEVKSFYKNLRKRWKSLMFYSANPLFLVNKKGIIAHGATYFMNTCRIEQDDVVIDLGSAPGDFGALAIRFGAKKIYCFDAKIDSGLMETARLNGDRIEIIPRYVSNYEEDGIFTTIDQFSQTIAPEKVSFIKMDIEGAEIKALSGAKKVIASHRPKMAICVYHDYSHLRRIKNIIQTIDSRYQFETLGPVLYCTPKKIL